MNSLFCSSKREFTSQTGIFFGIIFVVTQLKVGDRVCIRGLVQSDCLGLTGKILEVRQSALFGPGIQRCTVDFNGKKRRLLNVHLAPAAQQRSNATTAA